MDWREKLWLSCKKATFLIVKKEELKLGFINQVQLLTHLSICKFCKNFSRQSAYINKHVKHFDPTIHLSEKDKLDIIEKLKKNS